MTFEINERVKATRIKKGYTQEKLAFALNLKTSTYSQMEREGNISAETLKKIAKALNVDILDLLYDNNIISQKEETEYYTPQEESIITIIRNLTAKDRKDVIKYIELKYKAQKNKTT